jgi:DNA-binding beta-propeller fold protein YncE
VDNNSNVYVTSISSNKVVVLEPDGRQGRQLISSDDGLNRPTGLYFDKSKNCLLVTNYSDISSRFQANQHLLSLLNPACLAEKQQVSIL